MLLGGLAACSSDSAGSDEAGGASAEESTSTSTSTTAAPPLVDAFYAGVPLVVTMRTMATFAGLVGINRLFPTAALTNAESRFVVAPNNDTLYAIGVLDLSAGAQLLTLPAIDDRYHVVQILDAWMGQVALLGTRATGGEAGSWVLATAGSSLELPDGAERLECPTTHAFVLARIRATADDVDEAAAVAASIGLEAFGPQVATIPTLDEPEGPPNEVGSNGAAFFDELERLLVDDAPVTDAQREALAVLDGASTEAERSEAVDEGLAALDEALTSSSADAVDGWAVRLDLGQGAEDLSLAEQAFVARSFWGPVPAEEAVYPRCVSADDGEPLDGSKRYRIELAADDLPPVDAFWSYTVYGEDLYFVANPIDRFSISGETPGLVVADDGSITIALQAADPGDATVNWLPTPEGPFTLVMRCYLPQQPILDGTYRYPPVQLAT